MESNPQPVSPHLLRRYFYSGWAFFMPYLFCYLLYYWRKWPVNPGSGSHLPPLLNIYWALHVIHVVLGLLALLTWRNEQRSNSSASLSAVAPSLSNGAKADRRSTLNPQPSVFQSSSFSAILPWLLLALIFYVPGAYLEWPSDPWEHLRRINAWHSGQTVGLYPEWYKSSYFLAYSLLGWAFGLQQLFWLDFYYTGICLLLCWQYYRLARAVGLGERASLVFVILQALLLGNNVFSFYRYYGISSSIYSQLGAVALTRLGIEVMSRKLEDRRIGKSGHPSHRTKFRFLFSAFSHLASAVWPLTSALCLLAFIAFNHSQGIGIAMLGLAAVATWRLIAWKRSAGWILLAAAIFLSLVTVRWYPRPPAIDQMYRPQGYLNAWYGFNIFSLRSPAGDRMLQIIGAVGLVNLAAGLLLLRRNHPAGWLTVMPVIALSLPCVAIPFAGLLARPGNEIEIVTFQRMLFAIPIGLAMVCFGAAMVARRTEKSPNSSGRPFFAFTLAIASLVILTTTFPGGPRYNHFWHALDQTPADLRMHDVIGSFKTLSAQQNGKELCLVTTLNIGVVLQAAGFKNIFPVYRAIGVAMADSANSTMGAIYDPQYHGCLLYMPPAQELYTANSLAGQLSGHWPSRQAASDYAAGPELEAAAMKAGCPKLQGFGGALYRLGNRAAPAGK